MTMSMAELFQSGGCAAAKMIAITPRMMLNGEKRVATNNCNIDSGFLKRCISLRHFQLIYNIALTQSTKI